MENLRGWVVILCLSIMVVILLTMLADQKARVEKLETKVDHLEGKVEYLLMQVAPRKK